MVDVDDVQGYRRKFENQQSKLANAEIDDRDRRAIRRWVAHLRTNDPDVNSLGTVVGHLNRIRLSAERAHFPLADFERIDDVNDFELHLEDVHGLSEGTVRNYKKALRKFFLWRDGDEGFGDDVTVGAAPTREHDPADNITADELRALFDACGSNRAGTRDRALIAFLRDTALRIGAVLSLQMKHVDFRTARGTFSINEEANVKGASGTKPVTWSRSYVANWVDAHPRPTDDEAPLFCKVEQSDPTPDDDDGALAQQYMGQRLARIADDAGLDPERVHAHLFRATAISGWILSDVRTPKIEHRVDWVEGSDQRRAYQRVTDREFNDAIFDDLGIDADDETDTAAAYTLDIDDCPVCQTTLSGTEVHCPQCGAEVDAAAAMSMDEVDEEVREFLVNEDEAGRRAVAAEIGEEVQDDPGLARALLDELSGHVD